MSYEVLESKTTHVGKIVKVQLDTLRMPDGKTAQRETVVRGKNAAAVLPVDSDGNIIFVRQYRHAFREMLLEIPAGILEDSEDGETGAARELEEDAGESRESCISSANFTRQSDSAQNASSFILQQTCKKDSKSWMKMNLWKSKHIRRRKLWK